MKIFMIKSDEDLRRIVDELAKMNEKFSYFIHYQRMKEFYKRCHGVMSDFEDENYNKVIESIKEDKELNEAILWGLKLVDLIILENRYLALEAEEYEDKKSLVIDIRENTL